MQPYISRRRARRRSISTRFVFIVCGLIVTALIVGGVTQISRQSGPYDSTLNRSFGALGTVAAKESNATAAQFRKLLSAMHTLTRPTLQAELDQLVQQSQGESQLAATAQVPSGLGAQESAFAQAFAQRAKAVAAVRSAIDALLGLHPIGIAGSPTTLSTSSPALISAADASLRIAAAGTLLASSDQTYGSVRHALARSRGHVRLPRSVWVTNAEAWQAGAVETVVDRVAAAPGLSPEARLVLSSVRLTPQALPSGTGATAVLPPTTSLSISAVLTNLGTVAEPKGSVEFTLSPELAGTSNALSGSPVTATRTMAMGLGTSVVLSPVTFRVKPGHRYRLTVAVVLPASQSDVTDTSLTDDLEVAPST